ncbi:MarR family winged helix-turn-helix transcriptional regulator [Mameliella sediminis]|uniref:MarR family winged helix-turn-helix transcriptional regulator n=1 Tax=Mameliella sediminis TaxID=2836866 RepID=UPI001C481C0E|nr:MarR family winged helix-turn-helix transcriptional regulator [Mameliella sediminis]MBY6114579.1 MarR family winged helix-turn-helix transcriptional regulator [Antarctobacter heliothermus]MBY6144152.1 MarR family winged helix-turn-helix transcriptional regulator [Mameliella alba]MBV7392940.1 MarR family winged helix-turn-helix transcriptional regulator [Mameliella sediminis]MBY6161556.1 MarR family winged helix-turn-helix transcriptional regulator [Mameliella alba]MBY6169978.1 MarR family w
MKAKNLYEIVWTSRPLMQAAEASVEQGLVGTGLTVRMRAVLEVLSAHGDLTVPDIAAWLEIKRQYVQLMVNETLASGFTEQHPNPRHKRSPLLRLTDSGRYVIASAMSKELELMEQIGADLAEEEIATALRIVRAVTAKLKAQNGDVQ